MRILEVKEVKFKIEDAKLKLQRAIDNKALDHEIEMIEAEKAIWERVLHHVKNGEMITLDGDTIHWHVDVPTA